MRASRSLCPSSACPPRRRVTVMLALVLLCALTLVVLASPAGAQSVSVRA